MKTAYQRCCSLDVHHKAIPDCLISPDPKGKANKEVGTFGTVTKDILQLADRLTTAGCTHVAMHSTLEGAFEILVVNARHIKKVHGRKTDAKDAEWIAEPLRHGLLQGSYISDHQQSELRVDAPSHGGRKRRLTISKPVSQRTPQKEG